MKGVELTTSTVILLILGVIVLLCFIIFIITSKGQVDVVTAREALRNCCGDRSIYNCITGTIDSVPVQCKVSWSTTTVKLRDLMTQVGITDSQINSFCFCPS